MFQQQIRAERDGALAHETLATHEPAAGGREDPELDILRGIIETLRALVPASGALLLSPSGRRVGQGLCGLDSAFEWATRFLGQRRGQVGVGGESCRNMALGPAAFRSLAADRTRLLVVCFGRHSLALGLAALVRGPLEPPFLQEDCQQVEKLVPLVTAILWRDNGQPRPEAPPDTSCLSEREREVSRLLVMGYSGVNVAAITGLSENTIKTYIRRVYQKLGVSNRTDLVRALHPEVRPAPGRHAPEFSPETPDVTPRPTPRGYRASGSEEATARHWNQPVMAESRSPGMA